MWSSEHDWEEILTEAFGLAEKWETCVAIQLPECDTAIGHYSKAGVTTCDCGRIDRSGNPVS